MYDAYVNDMSPISGDGESFDPVLLDPSTEEVIAVVE